MKYDKQLFEAIVEEDFYKTNDILALICDEDENIEYVDKILKFMENNPDIDYGMPGPVVHYVEKFYMKGYEDLLLSSIERKPTIHTLWMLNRILNSPKLIDREKYIQVLKEVVDNSMESEDIRNEAKQYLQFQNGR